MSAWWSVPLVAGREISMTSSRTDDPTDQGCLLLKHHIKSTVSGVRTITQTPCAFHLTTISCAVSKPQQP